MATHRHRAVLPRWPGPLGLAAAALAVIALAGACSSSSKVTPFGAGHTASSTTTSTTSAVTTTTIDPTVAAILAAYRNDENVYLAVSGHYPVMATDPRLPQVMTGTELAIVRRNLTLAALHDLYATGTVDLAPLVTAVNGTKATISDCSFDHGFIIDGKTQQPVTKADTTRTLENVTMALETGIWKISNEESGGSGCVPATS